MGTWIAIAIGMFVLGTIMALKPSVVDMRLDKLRMTARRLELNPKVVACPDWVRGRNNEFGKGMIGQYSLIMDDMKFPETHYQVVDGVLRLENAQAQGSNVNSQSSSIDESYSTSKQRLAQRLEGEPLNLPPSMVPLVKGVYLKANSLVVFWQDGSYVQPATNPNFKMQQIEPELSALKSTMQSWAQKLVSKDS